MSISLRSEESANEVSDVPTSASYRIRYISFTIEVRAPPGSIVCTWRPDNLPRRNQSRGRERERKGGREKERERSLLGEIDFEYAVNGVSCAPKKLYRAEYFVLVADDGSAALFTNTYR